MLSLEIKCCTIKEIFLCWLFLSFYNPVLFIYSTRLTKCCTNIGINPPFQLSLSVLSPGSALLYLATNNKKIINQRKWERTILIWTFSMDNEQCWTNITWYFRRHAIVLLETMQRYSDQILSVARKIVHQEETAESNPTYNRQLDWN